MHWLERNPPHRPRRRPGRRPALRRPAAARDRPRRCAPDPVLLCLDEPAAGLNPRETNELNQLLPAIRDDHGTSILLLIEHDMSVVMEISDHVVVLDYGSKISDGTPREVKERPQGHRRLSRRGRRVEVERSVEAEIGGMSERTPRPAALEVRGVKTYYGNIIALKGVDLDVRGRDRRAHRRQRRRQVDADDDDLRQPARPRGHASSMQDRDITRLPTHEIARMSIAQSPEGRRIFPRMTVSRTCRWAPPSTAWRISSRISSASARSSRASRSGCSSAAARCRAASSRCSPSPARS